MIQLTGIAVLTVGAVIFTAYSHYHSFLGKCSTSHSFDGCGKMAHWIDLINSFISGDELWTAPTILMAIGAVVFVIAFLGCCGAIKESSCMVLTVSAFPKIQFINKPNGISINFLSFFCSMFSSRFCWSWLLYSKLVLVHLGMPTRKNWRLLWTKVSTKLFTISSPTEKHGTWFNLKYGIDQNPIEIDKMK